MSNEKFTVGTQVKHKSNTNVLWTVVYAFCDDVKCRSVATNWFGQVQVVEAIFNPTELEVV